MINLLLSTWLIFTPINCECNIDETTTKQTELNEVIIDNENVKVTLLDITESDNEEKGKQIKVKIDLANKTNHTIAADAKFVLADGQLVDESMIILWNEVESGKVGTLELEIFEVEGYEFPKLENNLEFTLYLFSWKNNDFVEEIPVEIEL